MLEGLDTIDWADLTHAYGRANDVPDQIRALRSVDPDAREKALQQLYGNVFHQGTRFEASSHVVPFLLELLADPATPDRVSILELLSYLAVGYGEAHLPAGYAVAEHRAAAGGGEALLSGSRTFVCDEDEDDEDEGEDEWDAEGDGGADDDLDEDDDPWGEETSFFQYMESLDEADAERLHAHIELLAYDAVRAGLPLVRSLLDEDDAEARTAAAYLLGWFPEEAVASLPSLIRAASDTEQAVAATALVSIGLVSTGALSVLSVLEGALDDPREVVRWGAAVGLARLRGPEAGQRVADELFGWVGSDTSSDEQIPYLDGNLRGYAARAARQLDD